MEPISCQGSRELPWPRGKKQRDTSRAFSFLLTTFSKRTANL